LDAAQPALAQPALGCLKTPLRTAQARLRPRRCGLGHDCLKRIATMQVEGLALVKPYALGISLHVLHYDGRCPGRIRLPYTKLDRRCQDWVCSIYEVGLHARSRACFCGHPAEHLEASPQQPQHSVRLQCMSERRAFGFCPYSNTCYSPRGTCDHAYLSWHFISQWSNMIVMGTPSIIEHIARATHAISLDAQQHTCLGIFPTARLIGESCATNRTESAVCAWALSAPQ